MAEVRYNSPIHCALANVPAQYDNRVPARSRWVLFPSYPHVKSTAPPSSQDSRSSRSLLDTPLRDAGSASAVDALATVVGGEAVTLFADRALYWPRERTLFIADVHLGKTATFRAHGVPMPRGVTATDLARLTALIERSGATRVVVLGDLLHARAGRVAALDATVEAWRDTHREIAIVLIRGNHDAHAGDPPAAWAIDCRADPYAMPPVPGLSRASVAALGLRAVRASASGCAAPRLRGGIRAAAMLRARRAARHPAGLRALHGPCDGGAVTGTADRRDRRKHAVRTAPPASHGVADARRNALSQNCNVRSAVRRLIKMPRAVDRAVDSRWKGRASLPRKPAEHCFCCRFRAPLLCIK